MNIAPSQYLPSSPAEFIGKTQRIAALLFKKAEQIKLTGGSARWLFSGVPGVGKSRLATLLANNLAHHPTAIESLNGQSCSVEVVRQWERSLAFKPIPGEIAVRVIDEVDRLQDAAANEMRTYLDRIKPGNVIIATTNVPVDKLSPQLQSRFFCYAFEPIGPMEFAVWMRDVWGFPYDVAFDIGKRNLGCVRSALIDVESYQDGKELAE